MRLPVLAALAALAGALPTGYHRKPSAALEKKLEEQDAKLERALAKIEELNAEIDAERAEVEGTNLNPVTREDLDTALSDIIEEVQATRRSMMSIKSGVNSLLQHAGIPRV